jgi:glycerol-3-phosphate acyltransferase PlsY
MLCVAPILAFTASPAVGFAFLCTSLICIWRHRENIGRLVGGTESKLNWRWRK